MKRIKTCKVVICNWKMNGSFSFLGQYVNVVNNADFGDVKVVIAPPSIYIGPIKDAITNPNVCIGAQEIHHTIQGSHTGSISVSMIKECGANYVIVGHSECRKRYIQKADDEVAKTVKLVFDHDLIPIICIGDTFDERSAAMTSDVISYQLKTALSLVHHLMYKEFIVAYEPVWAIGTGVAAQSDEILIVRDVISEILSKHDAKASKIIYGGSVGINNAVDFVVKANMDGLIIGVNSLVPSNIIEIVKTMRLQ